MDNLYTTKLVKIGTSRGVIIPTNILTGLNWQRGDSIIFTFGYDDTLIIKKLDDETIRRLKEQSRQISEETITLD